MLSHIKCEIPWVPYIVFYRKITTARSKGLKSSAKRHTLAQYKNHNFMVDINLPKEIEQTTGLRLCL